jgi:hypothetical protein
LFILSIKTFMMKVALRMIFTYLMEVVHIKLNDKINTCLTKEE